MDKGAHHLYLTDSVEVVLNSTSWGIIYHAFHFHIMKAKQFPQLDVFVINNIVASNITLLG